MLALALPSLGGAAPHQGSELADNWIGRMLSGLVKLPLTFANLRDDILNTATLDQAGIFLDRAPSSIDTLGTKASFSVRSIGSLMIRPFPTTASSATSAWARTGW